MNPKALYWLFQIKPVLSWSGAGIILGLAVAVHESGAGSVDWGLAALAAFAVLLIQYVAHPLNDLTDYPVDARANIEGTGRHKVLFTGEATKKDLAWMSAVIVGTVTVIAAYFAYRLPGALAFAAVGYFGLFAYNTKPLKLSYKPLTELPIDIPVNVAIVTGIAYVATGQLLGLALAVGFLDAVMAMTVHIGYFSMDIDTDKEGGKISTVVKYPKYPWVTIYSLIGLAAIPVLLVLRVEPVLLIVPASLFVLMTYYSMKMDWIRNSYMRAQGKQVKPLPFGGFVRGVGTQMTSTWEGASAGMAGSLYKIINVSIANGLLLGAALVLL